MNMQDIDPLYQALDSRIKFQRSTLAGRCKALADTLVRLAERLESNTPHDSLCVNDLGEIQSQGTIIDAECGRIGSSIQLWGMINVHTSWTSTS